MRFQIETIWEFVLGSVIACLLSVQSHHEEVPFVTIHNPKSDALVRSQPQFSFLQRRSAYFPDVWDGKEFSLLYNGLLFLSRLRPFRYPIVTIPYALMFWCLVLWINLPALRSSTGELSAQHVTPQVHVLQSAHYSPPCAEDGLAIRLFWHFIVCHGGKPNTYNWCSLKRSPTLASLFNPARPRCGLRITDVKLLFFIPTPPGLGRTERSFSLPFAKRLHSQPAGCPPQSLKWPDFYSTRCPFTCKLTMHQRSPEGCLPSFPTILVALFAYALRQEWLPAEGYSSPILLQLLSGAIPYFTCACVHGW